MSGGVLWGLPLLVSLLLFITGLLNPEVFWLHFFQVWLYLGLIA
jgi:hypothetical protein